VRLILVLACAMIVGLPQAVQPAAAQSRPNPFEANDDARRRHEAQQWNQYQQRGNQVPLGGYKSPLGDQPPAGTRSPGYVTPPSYQSPLNPNQGNRGRRY